MTASIVTAWHRELAVACAFSTAARVGAEAMPRSEVDRLTENIALALATIEQEERARVIEECAKVCDALVSGIYCDSKCHAKGCIECAAAIRARAAEKEAK